MYLGELTAQGQAAAAAVPYLPASDRQQLLDVLLATPEGKSHDTSVKYVGMLLGVLIGAGMAAVYLKFRK